MQAGMIRSYNSIFVDPDRLKIPRPEWKDLVYVVAFLHSVVIERKKYGPAGWCIPYEFSQDDMLASLNFLERFLQRTVEGSAPSYTTIQYMIGDVQYGGRITDPFDEELFRTYGKRWLTPDAVNDSKSKPPFVLVTANKAQYTVPTGCTTLEDYIKQIKLKIPENDTPEIFGLHRMCCVVLCCVVLFALFPCLFDCSLALSHCHSQCGHSVRYQ
jgi:dynein heavy chain